MASTALQIDALWSGLNDPDTGQSYSGAIVAFFAAGTTTPKAVWLDKDKTLPTAAGLAQTTLNSNGMAFLYGDGAYKINVYAPTDTGLETPIYTIDDAEYIVSDALTGLIYNTIDEMRASTSVFVDGEKATLLGYSIRGDDRGGEFYWDAASTTADDDIDVVKISSIATGRFKRLVTNSIANGEIKTTGGKRYQVLSCVIRNTGAGWEFINDSEHEPIGFTGISTLANGLIQLDHDFGATQVGSMLVTPDETFAKRGIMAGGSIGLDLSLITISAQLDFTVNTETGAIVANGLWGSDITATTSTGTCDITHPESFDGVPVISGVGSSDYDRSDVQMAYSTTTIQMRGSGEKG